MDGVMAGQNGIIHNKGFGVWEFFRVLGMVEVLS